MSEFHGPDLLQPIPDDLTTVQFMLDSHHASRPVRAANLPWLVDDATGREVYVDEIRSRTDGLANALSSRFKIGYDDVVCIFSPNHIDYPIAIWATHRIGGIITAANPAYTADELIYQLTTTKAKLIATHPWCYSVALAAARTAGLSPECVVLFDALPDGARTEHLTVEQLIAEGKAAPRSFQESQLAPGEAKTKLAFLSFSSGTTGLPKAVCIPHYCMIANTIQVTLANNADPTPFEDKAIRTGDTMLGVLPFYHIYASVVILHFGLFYGMKLVVVPRFEILQFLKSIERHRPNTIHMVPPLIMLLCKHPAVANYDLSSIRDVTSGAAPLSAELTISFSQLMPKCHINQGYGSTETCTVVAFPRVDLRVGTPGSSGKIMPGITARVVKADGTLAARGEPGELWVKGPNNALGYLNEEKATKDTFADGWVVTGDEVYFNEADELFVVDRIKEMLKVKGFQVAPAELEGHLQAHPDVADICIVGIPDEYTGEAPLAFVVLSSDARARVAKDAGEADRIKAALVKYVADAKIHYKRLTGGVEFIEAIPRIASGKLLRRVLRDRAREMRARKASDVKAKL